MLRLERCLESVYPQTRVIGKRLKNVDIHDSFPYRLARAYYALAVSVQ